MAIPLRAYQADDVARLRASYASGHKAPLYVLPTGGGKTYVFSYIAEGAARRKRRPMILVHRKELLLQASMSLAKIGLRHALIAQDKHIREAMGSHIEELSESYLDMNGGVCIASVDTIIRRLSSVRAPGMIICDEAHHLTKKNKWGKVVDYFGDVPLLGVTATPIRTDGKGLGKHADGYFDDMIAGPSMRQLIEMGNLLPPITYAPLHKLDMKGIGTNSKGDWNEKQLAAKLNKPEITGDVVDTYARVCPKVPAIAFCVTIQHARDVAAQFRARGFDFRPIDGTMHDTERRNLIRALSRGQIHGLTSCDLISEGTDIPVVGCGIMLRLTKSEGLYIQQGGRVLRPSPGQTKAYILDHVGNCLVHGLLDAEREWSLDGRVKGERGKKKDNGPEIRQCPQCYVSDAPSDTCRHCGYCFSEDAGRSIKQGEGEISEVKGEDAEFLRRTRKMEERNAKTLEDFIKIGEQRGHKNPKGWARIQMRIKEERKKKIPELLQPIKTVVNF